jgi:SAM-dependent methyltransferase
VRTDGTSRPLATHSWLGDASRTDVALFVEPCHGPTLDVGCGPGRLTEALASRGVEVLGIDSSAEAVRLTLARGAMALHLDVVDRLPIGSAWSHVLLADGNVGLGGDPVILLRRVRELLDENGTVLVELAATGVRSGPEQLRLKVGDTISTPFAWSVVGVDDIEQVAAHAGLIVMGIRDLDGRVVATLRPRGV